jgi:hypothetical protein
MTHDTGSQYSNILPVIRTHILPLGNAPDENVCADKTQILMKFFGFCYSTCGITIAACLLKSSFLRKAMDISRLLSWWKEAFEEGSGTRSGYEPREFTVCAAGAACPAHAIKIAEELGIS